MKILLAALLLSLSFCANAKMISLGDAGGKMFFYDSQSNSRTEDGMRVLVVTPSPIFNIDNKKDYMLFGAWLMLDCGGHAFAMDEIFSINKLGKKSFDIKMTELKFYHAHDHTIPDALLRHLCGTVG